jgi:hypothetical protein
MNTVKYILLLTLIFNLFSCQDVSKEESSYAELSIAQGGQWEEGKYINRTSFKKTNYLKLPDSHTDHSYFIRYEDPGWESDKVAYRLYVDWRNAIDIFGKKRIKLYWKVSVKMALTHIMI